MSRRTRRPKPATQSPKPDAEPKTLKSQEIKGLAEIAVLRLRDTHALQRQEIDRLEARVERIHEEMALSGAQTLEEVRRSLGWDELEDGVYLDVEVRDGLLHLVARRRA